MNTNGLIKGIALENKSNGLEVIFLAEGGAIMRYVCIKKQGGVIYIEKTEQVNTITEFSKLADKKYPVYLSLDGRGVLHRQFSDSKADFNSSDLRGTNREGELHEQIIDLNDGSVIKSYIRSDRVAVLLDELRVIGYYVLQIIIGPFACRALAETDNLVWTITPPGYRLQYFGGILADFSRTEDENLKSSFVVEGKSFSLVFLIAFANSVCHFARINNIGIDYPQLNISKEEYHYKKVINKLKVPFLMFCFLALVFNYLIYERYRAQNEQMTNDLAGEAQVISAYNKIESLITQKEKYLSSRGFSDRTMFAYYSDRIAGTIPEGIKLTRMTFSPEEKKVPGVANVTYRNEIIRILGITESGIILNRWLQFLKELKWIEDVRILGYSDSGNEPAGFIIEIEITTR